MDKKQDDNTNTATKLPVITQQDYEKFWDEFDEHVRELNRPWAITVLCILQFIAITSAIILSLVYPGKIGHGPDPTFLIAVAIAYISLIGLWYMQKWAVYLYVIVFALNIIAMLVTETWSTSTFVGQAFFIIIMLTQIEDMD